LADFHGKFNLKSNNNRGVGVRRRRSEASSNPPLFAIKIKLPAAGKAAGKRNKRLALCVCLIQYRAAPAAGVAAANPIGV
jgi:hypothetical protein